jgi:hypothetical protein
MAIATTAETIAAIISGLPTSTATLAALYTSQIF